MLLLFPSGIVIIIYYEEKCPNRHFSVTLIQQLQLKGDMIMERKLLFFDIDGTLLPGLNMPVPESTIAAIRRAQALGHYIFINTGRSKSVIPKEIAAMPFDGFLCGCGTHVTLHGNVLVDKEFDLARAKELPLRARELGIGVVLEGNDFCYYDSKGALTEQEITVFKSIFCDYPDRIKDTNECDEYHYSKFCIYSTTKEKLTDLLLPFADYFEPIDRGDSFFEVVPVGYSKASAIDTILAHLNQPLSDCYVFGDSSNDLSMLNHVPNSIAMGNSSPDVLAAASYVTTPVWRDGIANAMKHFGLI